MDTVQIELTNKKQVREFLDLPFRIYKEIPQWIPPLEADARLTLDPRRHPFYKHSEAAFFLAVRDGLPVGRLAVLNNRHYNEYNKTRTAFFYQFECEDDRKIASGLFESAFIWARSRGLTEILGPKGFTALDGFGMLVKGFEHRPAFGLPYNPPYYPGLIEALGFRMVNEAVSGHLDPSIRFPEQIHELSARIQTRRGLRIARFETRRDLRRLIPHLKDLYNDTLVGTSGNAPLTDDEVNVMADQLLWFADPKLVKIVMKGEKPVGFLLAYPDISAALKKTKGRLFPFGWWTMLRELKRTEWLNINGAGLLPEYRGSGGTAILFSEMFKSVVEGGQFRQADLVQIGTENDKMLRELRDLGVDFYKMHRVYKGDI
jgi:hypothetical protein